MDKINRLQIHNLPRCLLTLTYCARGVRPHAIADYIFSSLRTGDCDPKQIAQWFRDSYDEDQGALDAMGNPGIDQIIHNVIAILNEVYLSLSIRGTSLHYIPVTNTAYMLLSTFDELHDAQAINQTMSTHLKVGPVEYTVAVNADIVEVLALPEMSSLSPFDQVKALLYYRHFDNEAVMEKLKGVRSSFLSSVRASGATERMYHHDYHVDVERLTDSTFMFRYTPASWLI